MQYGEPRLGTIDDVSAFLSSIRERITIVALRQRMNLTERDVAELEDAIEECYQIHDIVLDLRERISDDYATRINRRPRVVRKQIELVPEELLTQLL